MNENSGGFLITVSENQKISRKLHTCRKQTVEMSTEAIAIIESKYSAKKITKGKHWKPYA